MRMELRFGTLFNALAIIINRFFLPNSIFDFFSGAFVGLGIFLIIVSQLPKSTYDNLLYRKWLASKNA